MKLTVVGGGSTYTPELVDGLARLNDILDVSELVLFDPATERLAVVGAFAQRILDERGATTRLSLTSDRDSAIEGASAVLLQLRVGGQDARARDESFPLECGCVGQETTGAGGLAKAMRTVPVVLDIAETVRKRASDAWIVDFTNPVGIVTRALLEHGHRAVGLCNVAIGFQRRFAQYLNVAPNEVELGHVGLNHLTWIRDVTVNGTNVLPRILAEHSDDLADELELPRPVLDLLGAIPSYYLRYFYAHDQVVDELRATGTRAEAVKLIERELLEMYADPALVAKPALLEQRGGAYYSEAAVALIASLLGGPDQAAMHVANVRNNGTLEFLPDDAVIEVPCDVTSNGATPRPVAPLDPLYSGLIAHVSAYENLALDAALHGSRDRVIRALLAHPLIGQYDIACQLADSLIAGNLEHLGWAR